MGTFASCASALCLGAIAAFGAGTALSDEPQWLCSAEASSPRVGSIAAQAYVDRDGGIVGQATLWSPPALRSEPLGGDAESALGLSIHASEGGSRSLAWDSATVDVRTSSDTFPDAVLELEVGSVRAGGFFDMCGHVGCGPHEVTQYEANTPRSWDHIAVVGAEADRSAFAVALHTAPRITATVATDDGQPLASAVYDLSGRAEAAFMARRIWRTVERMRRHPLRLCSETSPAPPADPTP
jgi:hypothetical protein